jgi:hypothetical protein
MMTKYNNYSGPILDLILSLTFDGFILILAKTAILEYTL